MAVAQVVDARVNPNNSSQRVELWGNGRIDVKNAAPITDGPQFFDRADQPVVVAIHIADWTTMAGYVLDKAGGFHKFNGAPSIGTAADNGDHEIVNGVPYLFGHWYTDWAWDPNTPGRGVCLDVFGNLQPFGGAPVPSRIGRRWAAPAARKLEMQWTPDVRAYTLAIDGTLHADYAAVPATPGFKWPGGNMAMDLAVTNWTDPAGYTLDRNGGTWAFGSATGTYSPGYKLGADLARTLIVLSPGDPLSFWRVGPGGQETEWTWSTPPEVIAGGFDPLFPAANTTDTTRPILAWAYSDLQKDEQAFWRVLVFTSAFVAGHSMTNPEQWVADAVVAASGIDPRLRGIASPVDLENGDYRMYVRAQDAAGQWSPWANRAWTQNVPLPIAPTGMTATVNDADATVSLSVNATTGGVADLIRFEFSDDAGATWFPVDGADAVALAATTTAVDRFPRQGKSRSYRAVAYSVSPRTASAPTAPVSATVPALGYLITSTVDAAAGGLLRVQEPVQWQQDFVAGVFQGLGADYPTVVRDGQPKAARGDVHILSLDDETWGRIVGLAQAASTLVYRDPFGVVRYCELVGGWPQELLTGSAFQRRLATTLPLVEVAPPHLAA